MNLPHPFGISRIAKFREVWDDLSFETLGLSDHGCCQKDAGHGRQQGGTSALAFVPMSATASCSRNQVTIFQSPKIDWVDWVTFVQVQLFNADVFSPSNLLLTWYFCFSDNHIQRFLFRLTPAGELVNSFQECLCLAWWISTKVK